MNVLVVSPHPDDESIGCGGTIARHRAAGDPVTVIFLTSGERAGNATDPRALARRREREASRATDRLGVTNVEFWRLPDRGLVANARLVERLASTGRDLDIELVYTTHQGETHVDHRASARAVHRAFGGDTARTCLYFEVWTPIQKLVQLVDISDFIDTKIAAIRAHASQCSLVRFDHAARGLARFRGELHSWPGGPYAEAFASR